MDPIRVGKSLRALRHRRHWTQRRLAAVAGTSPASISRIETGQFDAMPVARLVRVATALGARLDLSVRWNGEQLDRLLDEAHAHLVDATVRLLAAAGWTVAIEASFAVGAERGSIDVLAFRPDRRVLLVVEVKSVVPDLQGTLAGLDRKVRLAPRAAPWRLAGKVTMGRLLIVGRSATAYRRLAAHSSTLDVVLPLRGNLIRRWLRDPVGPGAGLLVVPIVHGVNAIDALRQRERVRSPGSGWSRGAARSGEVERRASGHLPPAAGR